MPGPRGATSRTAVDRLACVNVPTFSLQLLLQRRPQWSAEPVAIVADDKPQALILYANERATATGVAAGMRYGPALSLAPALRADVVSLAEIDRAVTRITTTLQKFSPKVEPSGSEPGVFWVDAGGLDRLYPSPASWAQAIRSALAEDGYRAAIAVGFSRFGTYAAAKAVGDVRVFANPDDERLAAHAIPLDRLHIAAEAREILRRLAVRSVGALLRLPPEGLLERFGPDIYRLHRLAAGALWTPLQPRPEHEPVRRALVLDVPETDSGRLLFLIKQLLDPLLATLAARGQALAALDLSMTPEGHAAHALQIRPATPTLDAVQILDLVRLQMEHWALPAGVAGITLTAHGLPAPTDPGRLFAAHARRDLTAAGRALARLRAAFGEDAVVRARLRAGHLPEARFAWEPVTHLMPAASPRGAGANPRTLVRRILARPIPIPYRPQQWRDGGGPYVVSGGWWARDVHRDYQFVETPRGDLLWVYYDQRRGRWYLHGRVE
jgi:protein ImuB